MSQDNFSSIEEEVAKIRQSFKNIDSHIKAVVQKRDAAELRKLSVKTGELSLVPPVSHSFSTVFLDSFSKSFKFQRMLNNNLMLSIVGGKNAINSKSGGKSFCSLLGVNIPKTYATNISTKDLNETEFSKYGSSYVVKPIFGAQSRNVFGLKIFSDKHVENIFTQKSYKDIKEACDDIRSSSRPGMKWEVEQLILNKDGNCSYDVKFYSFYGKVVLVLQVARWGKKREDVFFDKRGNIVDARIGKFYRPGGEVSVPLFNKEDIAEVERMSLQIPFPFCRVDFLAGEDKLYFGELTFNAGGAASFVDKWDRVLGEEFQSAQKRLMQDLLNGKDFSVYKSIAA